MVSVRKPQTKGHDVKKTGPYLGITGFMRVGEVIACHNGFIEAVEKCGTQTAREMKFMVGVLVSSKTLAGNTNKWTDRYPLVTEIPDIICLKREPLLYTIHYNTDDEKTLDEQVDALMAISPNIDAIQFNIRWASHVLLQRIRRKYPELRIILQIGAGALSEVNEPGDIFLGEALRGYESVVDDYLVDPSGGKGEALDLWRAFACIADHDIPRSMRPGIAGGRDADNLHEAHGLMRRLKRPVNMDTERRMRTDTPGGGHLIISEALRLIEVGVPLIGAY